MAEVNHKDQVEEQVVEKADFDDHHGILQVADIIHVHATQEQEAKVLRKIDLLYDFLKMVETPY